MSILYRDTRSIYLGIKTDCDDNMYVTGFMASNRGFIRKYDRDGNILWTKADFQDQVQELINLFSVMYLFLRLVR